MPAERHPVTLSLPRRPRVRQAAVCPDEAAGLAV